MGLSENHPATLYYFPVAPKPTRVRLYLAEKAALGPALPISYVGVDLTVGEQNSREHLARSRFGTVPVLELRDGTTLHESLAIIEYLEDLFPEPSLCGGDPLARALRRQEERVAETRVLNQGARWVHARQSPIGIPSSPQTAEAAWKTLSTGLAYFEEQLSDGRAFVAGDAPAVADCTLASELAFALFGGLELAAEAPGVHRWFETYRARPAVEKTVGSEPPSPPAV